MWTSDKNTSRRDIMRMDQSLNSRSCYTLGNMNACSDQGHIRNNQEDSVLLLCHPENKKFKLLAVADGMGGTEQGEMASLYVLNNLIHWFEKLPKSYYEHERNISLELSSKIQQINEEMRKVCNGGTTLAMAVVARYNTFLMNIGDSRIYIHKHHHLTQLSVDHSLCWDLLHQGIILHKDDIRFHKQNNYITSSLGVHSKINDIHSTFIANQNYDKLLLFTDGVTDSLSDYKINRIVETTSSKSLAKQLVDEALNTNSKNDKLPTKLYDPYIYGGTDNCTCAVLTKKL